MRREAYLARIRTHYEGQWRAQAEVAPPRGGAGGLPEGFSTLCFDRPQGQPLSIYASCGMSEVDDGHRIELHFCIPEGHPDTAGLLAALAAHHRHDAPIDLNHILDLGTPPWPGSRCTRGFVSLPYLWGPSLEWLHLREGAVRCLWLVPIMPEEESLCQTEGVSALESRIETAPLRYFDPTRKGMV